MTPAMDVTELLVAWSRGSQGAQGQLIEIVDRELKQLAKAYLRRECPNHSVAATALVHEAYLKLVDQRRVQWQNRSHFFGIAAQAMRRILVDHARAKHAAKRGGGELTVEPNHQEAPAAPSDVDVLALDEALSRLEAVEPRWGQLVELRFFAGDGGRNCLGIRGITATVKRDWSLARAWLTASCRGCRATPIR